MKIYGYLTSPDTVKRFHLAETPEQRVENLYWTTSDPRNVPLQWVKAVELPLPPIAAIPTDVLVPAALGMLNTAEQEIRVRSEKALEPIRQLRNELLALPLEN